MRTSSSRTDLSACCTGTRSRLVTACGHEALDSEPEIRDLVEGTMDDPSDRRGDSLDGRRSWVEVAGTARGGARWLPLGTYRAKGEAPATG